MTLYRETADGFVPWNGEAIPTPINRWSDPVEEEVDGHLIRQQILQTVDEEIAHPIVIEQLWSDDQLAALNLYRAEPAEEVPPHHRIVSAGVCRVGGIVRHVYQTELVPLADRKSAMLKALQTYRMQAETGGVDFGSMRIPTDDKTQSRVDQIVRAYADGDLTGTVSFKMPFGFVELGQEELRAIKRAVAQHIQSCFQREAEFTLRIEAAKSHADLDKIDFSTGWPSQQ